MSTPALSATYSGTSIGTTAVVVEQVEGTRDQLTRQLATRDDVFQNEVVETGSRSASELHFADDTRITVGPNSKIVLDEFVYDPDPGEGKLALKVTEGVFRFFSGNMASSNYSIETPSVTVGVRGTIIVGGVNPHTGAFGLILESGNSQATLTSGDGNTVLLDTPGSAAVAFQDGTTTVGAIPMWLMDMAGGMDNVIAQANVPAPPPGQEQKPSNEPVVAAAPPPPPPPPPSVPPAEEPEPVSDDPKRGHPRAEAASGKDKPDNANANAQDSEPPAHGRGGNSGNGGNGGNRGKSGESNGKGKGLD